MRRFFFEGEEMAEGPVKAERVRVEPLKSYNEVRIYDETGGGKY